MKQPPKDKENNREMQFLLQLEKDKAGEFSVTSSKIYDFCKKQLLKSIIRCNRLS